MNVPPTEIVPPGLAAHLHAAYGLAIASIASVPRGEDADAYCAMAIDGARYFVRVEPWRADSHLEAALAASATLREEGDLSFIVRPLPTMTGGFTSRLAASTIAVFPFVDGTTANDRSFNERDWQRLAANVAALHASELPGEGSGPPRETFANPFIATIRRALRRAASPEAWPSSLQRQTAEVLRTHRADLEAMMQQFDALGEQARRLAPGMVVTHGDPNLSNVLLDDAGALWMIDWGSLGLGPRERDLFAFTEDRFASFLEAYLDHAGPVQLHLDLFAFYAIRWVLQEIADYSSRLLLVSGDADTLAHAWQELQPYLPIPHAALASDLDAVRQTLAPFVHTGQVQLRTTPA